jgi:acyl-CoA oxidase
VSETPQNPQKRSELPLDDPQLLAFLPMLYVAWADGDLQDGEIKEICTLTTSLLGQDCGSALGRWLDPKSPPSAADLQRLLKAVRRGSEGLTDAERLTLSELGIQIAHAGGMQLGGAERQALDELERALGVLGPEASRELLTVERPAADAPSPEPGFLPGDMTPLLEPTHAELREELRSLLSRPEFGYRYDLDRQEHRRQILEWTRELARRGYGALSFPERYGGAEDIGAFVAAFETLAYHDLSLLVKFGVQFGLFGGSIQQLGTEKHHARYLEAVGRLELPGCFAMTETGHGSNVAEIETTAVFLPETREFEVRSPHRGAGKDYIGNAAAHGRLATVFAQLEVDDHRHGVHAFLVPIRDQQGEPAPGVEIGDCGPKMGLNGVDNGRLWFDRVRVPYDSLLDRFGSIDADGNYASEIASPSKRFFTMLGTLIGGRVSVALAGLSVAKSALAIAVRYGSTRRQFGASGRAETVVLDYRTHQRRLMPRLATTYALSFALQELARDYARQEPEGRRELEGRAAGLKAFSTWHATDTAQTCRECCGGQGYLAFNRLADLKADSDVFTTFEGDNTVLLQLLAKGLLTGYRRQFSEMNLIRLTRYVASELATRVSELNPLVTHTTDEAHLRDAEFQLGALRWREDHLLGTLARRLKKRIDRGAEAFDAVVDVQDHMLATAKAHVERLVLESFQRGVESADEETLRQPLRDLRDLFALHRIESDRGWFLEQGYLAPSKAKAIRKLVNRLCREVRAHAVPLVDGFGIPDALLAAPIALARPTDGD